MSSVAGVVAALVATSLGVTAWGQALTSASLSTTTSALLSIAPASAKAGPSARKPAELPAVDQCGWTASFATRLVRPESLLVMCGDGNGGLIHLDWASWGRQEAVARGVYTWNKCVPECAAPSSPWGHTPASVTLTDPLPTPRGPLFALLSVHVVRPTRDTPESQTILYVPTEVACDRTNRRWAREHHVSCPSA